jgi:hypothetical protein
MSFEAPRRKLPYESTEEYAFPEKGWEVPGAEVNSPKDNDENEKPYINKYDLENPKIIDIDPEAPEDTDLEIPAYPSVKQKEKVPFGPQYHPSQKEPSEREEDIDPVRRNIVIGGVGATIAGTVLAAKVLEAHENEIPEHFDVSRKVFHREAEHFGKKAALAEQVFRVREREVNLSALKGAQIGALGHKILGVPLEPLRHKNGAIVRNKDHTIAYKPLPETATVRYDQATLHLWEEKLYTNKHWTALNEKIGKECVDTLEDTLDRGNEDPMDVSDFIKRINEKVLQVRTTMDEDKMAIMYGYEKDEVQKELCLHALEVLAAKIDGQLLASYGMTETFDVGENSKVNAEVLNTVLKGGGTAYVARIPALYDKQPSFGFWQGTPLAMSIIDKERTVKGKDGKRRVENYKEYVGASKMNRAVGKEQQIPEEIQSPEGFAKFTNFDDQITFAFLFSLHNVAEAIEVLYRFDPQFVKEFESISQETLMEFISASHHKPHPSQTALLALIRHLSKNKTDSLHSELPKDLQKYAQNTVNNHQSLKSFA